MPFLRLYFAFAAGYLLSYLFRSVNAVISPELTHELGLAPASLGLLTSAYFVAFAAMQIPAGMLLDRYGPRRVEPLLLLLAGTGALAFALADSVAGLVAARALIGGGVAVCLMAPLRRCHVVSAERRVLAGWMMDGRRGCAARNHPPSCIALCDLARVFVTLAVNFAGWWIWPKVPDAEACADRDSPPSGPGSRAYFPIGASGGSRRSRVSAWARSWRSRGFGPCRG
jgi:hypothetical protein